MFRLTEELKKIEKSRLKDLLRNPTIWSSKFIDYHLPHVERLTCRLGTEYKLNLHVIRPCSPCEALVHTHAQRGVVHVLPGKGIYRMGVGIYTSREAPLWDSLIPLEVKGGDFWYETTQPNECHWVAPEGEASYSVTLIETKNFPNSLAPRSTHPLKTLGHDRVNFLLPDFYERLGY